MINILLAIAFYLLGAVSLIANEDLVVKVTPKFCQDPCQIKVTIHVNWDMPKGQRICLILDSPSPHSIATMSCWPYAGVKTTEVSIKAIPTGTYQVSVETKERFAHTSFEVS